MLGSTALGAMTAQAADQEISWIYCGDKIDPVHDKYIKEWEGKNAGWKVAPEVVGWEPVPGQGDDARRRRHAGRAWPMSARAR